MKNEVIKIIEAAIKPLGGKADVELTPSKGHGDFSTNIALKLTKDLKDNPRNIATKIVENIKADFIEKCEIAGPGFINIFISDSIYSKQLKNIIKAKDNFGKGNQKKYINVEYVSANPTGYLHVGHARGAAIGATLSQVLKFAGNKVDQEYYINDAGSQIKRLGVATFARYSQALGKDLPLPKESYHGKDIIDLGKKLAEQWKDKYVNSKYEDVQEIFEEEAKKQLLETIKKHLGEFNVVFDLYSSEKELYKGTLIKDTLKKIEKHTFKKDGATWLKTIVKGDDKDRVLIKTDKTYTYLTPDISYHNKKLSRGYDELINIWGADHIGYIKRMEVALGYLGLPAEKLDVLIVQLVRLIKDGKELKMSKRLGTSFTLKELLDLVGSDATRFYMINRSHNSPFDFNIDLASKQSSENPIFTIKYTHARANQLLEKSTKDFAYDSYTEEEKELIKLLNSFPGLIEKVSINHKVHLLTQYLMDVSKAFNSYYSNNKMIGSNREAMMLPIVQATKIVLKNTLSLIGIKAPNKM